MSKVEFTVNLELEKTPITSLRAMYAIDTSGSTGGSPTSSILSREITSVQMLREFIPCASLISWNSTSTLCQSLDALKSSGMTVPSTIVPYLRRQPELSCFVLYTDGQITKREMETFTKEMSSLPPMPFVCVFTMQSGCTLDKTIEQAQRQVDMSIPEACLAMTSDALIIINVNLEHKVLMSTGAFQTVYEAPLELSLDTTLESLPDFDMSLLNAADSPLSFYALPDGHIRLPNRSDVLVLKQVYEHFDEMPIDLLKVLCNRALLPKLNTMTLHQLLSRRLRSLNENPKADELRAEIAKVAVDETRAGGEEHRRLLDELQEVTRETHQRVGGNVQELRSLIHRFLSLLAAYNSDKTSIALGSNRANRAAEISAHLFDEVGDALSIEECPIYLQKGVACLLLTHPDDHAQDYMEWATSDLSMEAPFWFGAQLVSSVTPGLYCMDFARQAKTNPYTRAPIIGFLPLSKDPVVMMRFMARIFGASREMWHFVRGYIGMIEAHLRTHQWANEQRALLEEQVHALVDAYACTYNLKGGTDDRRPLRACLEHVTTDYGVCLRDRHPDDVRTIVRLTEWLLPKFHFEKEKILGMANVIDQFAELLAKHKRKESMMGEVMELDEYEHCVREQTSVRSLIARILWADAQRSVSQYHGLKLQMAVERALNDKKYGHLLRLVFAGKPVPKNSPELNVKCDEPKGTHFGTERYGEWSVQEDGSIARPRGRCVYCGHRSRTQAEFFQHLKEAFGVHYYNGQLAVQTAVAELGDNASEVELFKCAKRVLYRKYGEMAVQLHTKRCKTVLLLFIQRIKAIKNELKKK